MSRTLASQYAPSFSLIKAHFGAGLLGMIIFSVALVLRASVIHGHFFQPLLLGLVHLCVLGWLMPITLGALHQLVPVVFEVPVRSERLAWAAFALYVPAVTLFITRMWTLEVDALLPVSATAAALAVWLYAANLVLTLVRSAQRSLTGACVITALLYLVVAVTLGAMLAWHLFVPYLPIAHVALLRAHAHVAGLGFFGLLIMGVAYRLLEMFLLSHGAPERAGWWAFGAVNAALTFLVAAFLRAADPTLSALGLAAGIAGIAAFLVQIGAIFQRRMQRYLDVAWLHISVSFGYLALTALTGCLLVVVPVDSVASARLHVVYGLVALPGFIGTIVVGQLYKIVPFLVWLHRFAPYVGLKTIPSAGQLLPELPKRLQFVCMHLGMGLLLVGVAVDAPLWRVAGASAMAVSAAMVVGSLGFIFARKP
ncbi:MAG: hypothetical protein HY904_05690 [Deltaproteobacteria bacterium]|nr:hypothetical protein [Deltaproteobacteria bacterium]